MERKISFYPQFSPVDAVKNVEARVVWAEKNVVLPPSFKKQTKRFKIGILNVCRAGFRSWVEGDEWLLRTVWNFSMNSKQCLNFSLTVSSISRARLFYLFLDLSVTFHHLSVVNSHNFCYIYLRTQMLLLITAWSFTRLFCRYEANALFLIHIHFLPKFRMNASAELTSGLVGVGFLESSSLQEVISFLCFTPWNTHHKIIPKLSSLLSVYKIQKDI